MRLYNGESALYCTITKPSVLLKLQSRPTKDHPLIIYGPVNRNDHISSETGRWFPIIWYNSYIKMTIEMTRFFLSVPDNTPGRVNYKFSWV